MKKTFLFMFAVLLVTGCEKPILGEVEDEAPDELGGGVKNK